MSSSVLHGSAVKVLSSGVVVKLEDGREGFLPRREFTKLPTRDLRQVVKLGDVFEVIPEEYVPAPGDETTNRILLHRVSGDSWERLAAGSVVTGVVAGIEPYGVFVDLLPGITGLVARAELANAAIKRIEDVIWVGDVVRCHILSIDRAAKRVALSVKSVASARQALLQDGMRLELAAPPPASTPAATVLSAVRQDLPALKILVVDDGDDLREELADHLEHFGHAVEQAATASAAQSALDNQSCCCRDRYRLTRSERPGSRRAVVTGGATSAHRADDRLGPHDRAGVRDRASGAAGRRSDHEAEAQRRTRSAVGRLLRPIG
jgi:predicted RNA-binding protein with RPS1 domain